MHKKKTTYVPMPEVPPEMKERFTTMLLVVQGSLSVKVAAKKLGMSRNHFQTLLHRGMRGFLEEMSPKKAGRPPAPEKEVTLSQENEKLRRQNETLLERVETTDRMLAIAGGLLRGQVKPRSRASRPRAKTPTANPKPEEPDGAAKSCLEAFADMRDLGLWSQLAADAVGKSMPTLRRWAARQRRGQILCRPRGPKRASLTNLQSRALVERHVRDLNGLVGAASLAKTFTGVSRRQCAAIKKNALVAMENERVARCERITVTTAGVVRGFDQMHIATVAGPRVLLFSGDGAIQYRTSVAVTESYDGPSVARALEHDFAENGAPLVVRMDRARSHQVPEVRDLVHAYGVLVLHGPPRHPRYYGQLERQNREHRAWFDANGLVDPDELAAVSEQLRRRLNILWRRPTLGWQTAQDLWDQRPKLDVDRAALREEVRECAARLRRASAKRDAPCDLAERLAIEHALTTRGYLKRQPGGWC
jgi:transposase